MRCSSVGVVEAPGLSEAMQSPPVHLAAGTPPFAQAAESSPINPYRRQCSRAEHRRRSNRPSPGFGDSERGWKGKQDGQEGSLQHLCHGQRHSQEQHQYHHSHLHKQQQQQREQQQQQQRWAHRHQLISLFTTLPSPSPLTAVPHAAQLDNYHDPHVVDLASLAYRPLHLPLHATPPTEEFEEQRLTQQLPAALAAASSTGFPPHNALGHHQHRQQQQQTHAQRQSSFRTIHCEPTSAPLPAPSTGAAVHHRVPLHHSLRKHRHPPHPSGIMAYPQQGEDELAEMQKLSNEYEPEVTGPLVSQRQLSKVITSEYASADPVYRAKTATLPDTYSHCRTIRGDGKCGWRAVAFGYFEALIRTRDGHKFFTEEARLQSLSNVAVQAGFDAYLWEDFADETFDLLRKISSALLEGHAESVLYQSFLDDNTQNSVITYLKTLTAAWMKTHEADYAPWLHSSVEQYCNDTILPVGAMIDHVGLTALKDVLLSPACIALEVLYLDRSEGTEVTTHRFDPVNSTGYILGNVRLLYRPGHYDLLYKPEEVTEEPPQSLAPQAAPVPVQAFLQLGSQSNHGVYEVGGHDLMLNIPGMTTTPQWMSSGYGSISDFYSVPTSMQSGTESLPTPACSASQSSVHSQSMFVPATNTASPTYHSSPSTQVSQDLPFHTVSHHAAPRPELQQTVVSSPFRPSAWQLEPDFVSATLHAPFQTSIFRNSHFNTAHFLNPEFQPEQWDPEDEYTTFSNGKSTRHKSAGSQS